MPNPILKYAMLFNDNDGFGWSEIHYAQAGSENPNLGTALGNFVSGLVQLRRALLAQDQAIVGTRVSYRAAGAIRSLPNRQAFAGNPDWKSLPSATSLALLMQNANGSAKKIIHMRGLPTVINDDGEYIEDAEFKSRLDAFVAGLTNGFGWPTKDPASSSDGNVTTYTVDDVTTKVTFTLQPINGVLPAAGTRIFVRFSRLNNGRSALNRELLCEVVDATHVKTVNQVASAPFLAAGHYNYRATTFVTYNQQGSKSIGERRPGRPINRLPGRSRARPLA